MPSIFERIFRRSSVVNVVLSGDASTQVLNFSAKELYQTQDNLRAVVDFLSNSIAQLPLKVYTRDGETERRRDRDSTAALLLYRPNEDQTEFEFVRAMAIEYFVFGSVYVWLANDKDSPSGYQLRIIPSDWVDSMTSATAYAPDVLRVRVRNSGTLVEIPRTEFVQFKTYSAGNPGGYLSPISALRQTLTEQVEAGKFRKQLWSSSGRLNAQITRPANVQAWDDETRKKFAQAFREAWGANGSKAGSIPILEDGMKIEPFHTSFKESEWAQSVKLSRESVAAAYGVNPSLIWHSDTQTYASAKDNARSLYAECLGPVLQMFQQRINAFLLPMIGTDPNTYVEFDLSEKLKGSFEERASILQSSVGAPWLTRNEARADMNLPPIDGGDELITPLNVTEGGQPSPNALVDDSYSYPNPVGRPSDDEKSCSCHCCKDKETEVRIKGQSTEEEDEKLKKTLTRFFRRQRNSVLPKIGADNEDYWDEDRWNIELANDLEPLLQEIADAHGIEAADLLEFVYTPDITRGYLEECARMRARAINEQTRNRLALNLESDEPDPAHVFDLRESQSETLARSAATFISSWAVREAAHQAISAGAPSVIGRTIYKEWVTGANARPSHAAMDGQRVPIDADFSNGMHWPGEDTGDPDESCGCNCSTQVIIE